MHVVQQQLSYKTLVSVRVCCSPSRKLHKGHTARSAPRRQSCCNNVTVVSCIARHLFAMLCNPQRKISSRGAQVEHFCDRACACTDAEICLPTQELEQHTEAALMANIHTHTHTLRHSGAYTCLHTNSDAHLHNLHIAEVRRETLHLQMF